jgi:DNA-binding IclR family transcriptional regulator
MASWTFLTNHARVLVCIAHDPGIRIRDVAATVGITERRAFGIVGELVTAGYVVKEKDGRRNRYRVQAHLPLREAGDGARSIGEVLDILLDANRPEAIAAHVPAGRST